LLLFKLQKSISIFDLMAARTLDDERMILLELAAGSESAFVRIFDRYSSRVYRSALKFLGSKESAEEIVQDVFLDIWLKRKNMAEVLNFGGYLQGMVRKQVYDAYRGKSVFTDIVNELSYPEPSDNATERMIQEHEYDKLLQEAVDKLPEHQRQIFRMAREEGLSHEAIANRMNLSRLAVKSHMKRALRFVRAELEPLLGTEFFLLTLIFWPDSFIWAMMYSCPPILIS
jgi:RNA polymerase sigma-70 factor (family 1)